MADSKWNHLPGTDCYPSNPDAEAAAVQQGGNAMDNYYNNEWNFWHNDPFGEPVIFDGMQTWNWEAYHAGVYNGPMNSWHWRALEHLTSEIVTGKQSEEEEAAEKAAQEQAAKDAAFAAQLAAEQAEKDKQAWLATDVGKHESMNFEAAKKADTTKKALEDVVQSQMIEPMLVIEETSPAAKQVIAAKSQKSKVSIDNHGVANALTQMGVSPKRPEILAIINSPTQRADNFVNEFLKTRRFENALLLDNINFFTEIMKLDGSVAPSWDLSVSNIGVTMAALPAEIAALATMRAAIDKVGDALDIRESSTSIIMKAKAFYDQRRDSAERFSLDIPVSSIDLLVKEYVGRHTSDINKMSNTLLLFDIIRAVRHTSERWSPAMLYSPPEASTSTAAPFTPARFPLIEAHQATNGAASIASTKNLGQDPNDIGSIRVGGYSSYLKGHDQIYNGPLTVGWQRSAQLCSVFSNEMVLSAGIGNMMHSQLGKRFGVNSGDPLALLLGNIGDLGVAGAVSVLAKQATPGSFLDYLVIGEEQYDPNFSGGDQPITKVLPFEPAEVIDTSGASSVSFASGREFFVEAPFRMPTGVLAQTDFNNFKKYASDFNNLTNDYVSYMDRLFALNVSGIGLEPERILIKVLKEVKKAAELLSTASTGSDAMQNSINPDKPCATLTTLLLNWASLDDYQDKDCTGSVKIKSWRYLLTLICLQFRDDIDRGVDVKNWEKYIKAVEAGEISPPPKTARDSRFAIPTTATTDYFEIPLPAPPFDGPTLYGKDPDHLSENAVGSETYVQVINDMLSGKESSGAPGAALWSGWSGADDYPHSRYGWPAPGATNYRGQHISLQSEYDRAYTKTHPLHHNLFRPWPGDDDFSFLSAVVRIAREIQITAHSLSARDGEDYTYLDGNGLTLFNGVSEDVIISIVLELFIQCFSLIDADAISTFSMDASDLNNNNKVEFGIAFKPTKNAQLVDLLDVIINSVENGTPLSDIFDGGSIVPNVISTTLIGRDEDITAENFVNFIQSIAKNREYLKFSTGAISAIGDHILEQSLEMQENIKVLTGVSEEGDKDLVNYFKVFTNTPLGKNTLKYLTRHQPNVKTTELLYNEPVPSMSYMPRGSFLSKHEKNAVDILINDPHSPIGPADLGPGSDFSSNTLNDSIILAVGIPMGTIDYLTNPVIEHAIGMPGVEGAHKIRQDTSLVRIKIERVDHEDPTRVWDPIYFTFDMNLFVLPDSVGPVDVKNGYGTTTIDSVIASTNFSRFVAGGAPAPPGKLSINGMVDVLDLVGFDQAHGPEVKMANRYRNHMYDFLLRRFLYEATGVDYGCSSYRPQAFSALQDQSIEAPMGWDLWKKMSEMTFVSTALSADAASLQNMFAKITDEEFGNYYSLGRDPMALKNLVESTAPKTRTLRNETAQTVDIITDPAKITPGAFRFFADLSTSPIFSPNRIRSKILAPSLFDRVFLIPIRRSYFMPNSTADHLGNLSFDGFSVSIDVASSTDDTFDWASLQKQEV